MTEAATSRPWRRLGLAAGGGELPVLLAEAEPDAFILRLTGFCDSDFEGRESAEVGIGEFGKAFKALKDAGCDAICFAGYVNRPDFSALKLDARGALFLPKAVAAARKGDNGLLQALLEEFDKNGYRPVGADEVLDALKPEAGVLGAVQPDETGLADARKALQTARAIGGLDIGQGAVVADGLVLAVEAQEGTNAMLERVAGLPAEVRGTPAARRGALGKAPKPIQDRRIDLPTFGLETVERARQAGLAGLAMQAGAALIIDREAVIAAADAAGLFLYAEEPEEGAS
jgi:DUF1009 family protein